jgi:hypothetical protein
MASFLNYTIKYSIFPELVTKYLIFRDNKELRREIKEIKAELQ